MKQKLFIVVVLVLLVVVLGALNAATYVQKDKTPDTEMDPNRSTFHTGSTGTQAFYSLLAETGRKVTRWRTSLDTIASDARNRPSVFIMIGPLRRELSEVEKTELMQWVSAGGTLILIDRDPSRELAMSTTQWQMNILPTTSSDLFFVDASNPTQMIAGTAAHKPVQPTYLTNGVNAVQPSRFASSIELTRFEDYVPVKEKTGTGFTSVTPTPSATPYDFYSSGPQPPPPPAKSGTASDSGTTGDYGDADYEDEENAPKFESPLVHIAGSGKNLLVETPFAAGRIIVLADPYIVSNNGITLVDNSRLAVNLATSREGMIAFDEYHHGYGANNNRFFQYFEGTPVIALVLQCGLLVALVFFSQSRRFARPVPEPEPDRLSKLEYVSAMAELQQRTQAYDLAIENIYADFRRRVSALVGLDNTTASRGEIAGRVAERIGMDVAEIEHLMFKCEEIIHGEAVSRNDTVTLVEKIRDIEEKIGLKRSARKGV